MKPRKPRPKKFKPPKATDPPTLVEIDWIDAQSEIDFEGPGKKAGGLVLLPTAGYHIRNGRHPHHGPFVVIGREWFRDEESNEVYTRDTTSIPTGWIRKWSVVRELVTVWPTKNEESGTTTSPTRPPLTKTPEKSESTTSKTAADAGASPSALESPKTPLS
jgi:hypothetical protein